MTVAEPKPVDTRVHLDDYWFQIVAPVVRAVENRYAHYVDSDDLAQEAALWWYSRNAQAHMREYLEEDNWTRLRRSIYRALAKYAEGEKGQKVGYDAADQVRYLPAQIDALIGVALDPDGLPDGGGVNDLSGIHAKKNLAEGGDTLVALIDVRRAVQRGLTSADESFLRQVKDHHQDWEQLAALARAGGNDVQPDSIRRRYDRVLERIARTLNNEEVA